MQGALTFEERGPSIAQFINNGTNKTRHTVFYLSYLDTKKVHVYIRCMWKS